MNAVTQAIGKCPCVDEGAKPNCYVIGTKLTRFGHLVGCACASCQGRRNRRSGQRAQARTHKRLGGEGFTPTHEEAARPYTVEVTVMPETKNGKQIPASFDKFIGTDWFRRALDQSARATPVGAGVRPAVSIRGQWVIVDIRGKT